MRLVTIAVEREEAIVLPAALVNRGGYVLLSTATSASDPNPHHWVLRCAADGGLSLLPVTTELAPLDDE